MKSHRNSSSQDLPQTKKDTETGNVGERELLTLLAKCKIPAFKIATEEDYGLDILAYVVVPHFQEISSQAQKSDWIRRSTAATAAYYSKTPPKTSFVPGQVIGFQVKTDKRYVSDSATWIVYLDQIHQNFLQNSDFPVFIVGSDPEGVSLRYAEINPADNSTSIKLTTPLTVEELTKVMNKALSSSAQQFAKLSAFGLLSTDSIEQQTAARLCWAVAVDPGIIRLASRQLPELEIDAMQEVACLLAGVIGAFNEATEQYPDDPETANVLEEYGLTTAFTYSDAEWRCIIELWTDHQVVQVEFEMIAVGNDSWFTPPQDPWPDSEGDEFDLAKRAWNRLYPGPPWDALVTLLIQTEDPVGTLIRIAQVDLDNGTSSHTDHWWGTLIAQVARQKVSPTRPIRSLALTWERAQGRPKTREEAVDEALERLSVVLGRKITQDTLADSESDD